MFLNPVLFLGLAAAFLPTTFGASYCTGVHTQFNISDGSTGDYLGTFGTDLVFDSPRPNYSRFRVVNISQSVVNNSVSFGAFFFNDITQNMVQCGGVGCSGLLFNNYANIEVNVTYNGSSLLMDTVAFTILYQGTIFYVESNDYTPSNPCTTFREFAFGDIQLETTSTVCCNRWKTYNVPTATKTCKKLQGKATFQNGASTLAVVNATASVNSNHSVTFSNTSISSSILNVNVSDSTLLNYFLIPNYNPIDLQSSGNQLYLSTNLYGPGINLLSTLGYFEYHDGQITGFNGQGLDQKTPCISQNIPNLQLNYNPLYPSATSVSEICCVEFGDVSEYFEVFRNTPEKKKHLIRNKKNSVVKSL